MILMTWVLLANEWLIVDVSNSIRYDIERPPQVSEINCILVDEDLQ